MPILVRAIPDYVACFNLQSHDIYPWKSLEYLMGHVGCDVIMCHCRGINDKTMHSFVLRIEMSV